MTRSMLVKDHMAKEVLSLHPEMDILRAVHLLIKHDVSGAPVLDRHGRLVGVLTERDCIRIALEAGYHGNPGGPVADYMSADPKSVHPDESIIELASMFIEGRFHRYPVVDEGRLVGIIARRDVMRALGEHYPL